MEEGKANMTRINNDVYEETNRMKADVSSYVKKSEANSNQELLTDQYVKLQVAKLLSNNIGSSILLIISFVKLIPVSTYRFCTIPAIMI